MGVWKHIQLSLQLPSSLEDFVKTQPIAVPACITVDKPLKPAVSF